MKLLGYQGDVCFYAVKDLPAGLIQDKQTANAILAYGEASGHAHQFDELDAVEVFKDPKTNLIYLNVKRRASVSHGRARDFVGRESDHDYHNVIFLEPGLYAAGIVEETDWLSKTIRRVVD
jgi:hypothetical protein